MQHSLKLVSSPPSVNSNICLFFVVPVKSLAACNKEVKINQKRQLFYYPLLLALLLLFVVFFSLPRKP
jgi:hypothetical protein